MNNNVIVNDEEIRGNVKDVREYIIGELIRQSRDSSISEEMFLYNNNRFLEILQKLEWLIDNTEIIIKEFPMGNLELDIVELGLEKNMKEEREKQAYLDELYYHTFILGYDLLNDRLQASELESPCDTAYDICISLAKQYLNSEEYKNLKYSSYEMLVYWLNDNKELVDSYFIGDDK